MGLDMYLSRDTFIGGKYDHRKVKGKVDLTIEGKKKSFNPKNISYITEEVGYWRKANQIHNWFVQNVQDGKDECQRAYVELDKLKALYSSVCIAIDKKDPSIFEPVGGFFFGSTDIDDYYWKDLEDTKAILEKIFADDPDGNGTYYYQSSW